MKRLIIVHQHDPGINHVGGVGTFINTLLKYAPDDFEVSLVGVSEEPQKRPLGRWQRMSVGGRSFDFLPLVNANPTYHGRFPLSVRFVVALGQSRRLIDFKDAIIEFHRIEPEIALKDLTNPKVLFFHTHTKDLYNPKTEVFWKKFPWLYFWLEKNLIQNMDQLYSVRADTIEWYRERYPKLEKPFIFLPTWADEEVFQSLPEAERKLKKEELCKIHGLNPEEKMLLFAGRFELQKDPFLLLETAGELRKKNPGIQLVMIGAGSLEASLREAVREKGLEKNVFLIRPEPQSRIAQWMNASDCLLLTSAYEGMPRVVMEALQCGLPAVAMAGSEAQRVLQNEAVGRLVEERDPKIISRVLEEILSQPPDREACQKAVAPFKARQILERLFTRYRQFNGKHSK